MSSDPFATTTFDTGKGTNVLVYNDTKPYTIDSGGIPTEFRQAAIVALWDAHVNVPKLDPMAVDRFITEAWKNSELQARYNASLDPSMNITFNWSDIKREAFDPAQSTRGPLFDIGMTFRQQSGLPLTNAEQQIIGDRGSATTPVPAPFASQFFNISGHAFNEPDEDYSVSHVHEGVDYGLPTGTPLTAPVAGKIHIADQGNGGYGKYVELTMADGTRWLFGHLSDFGNLVDGQTVNPGDSLGLSGSTGNSSGPHLHLGIYAPDGGLVDPGPILEKIFKGTTFEGLGYTSTAAGGTISKQAEGLRKLGVFDTTLNSVYAPIADVYKKYFGREPVTNVLRDILAHGPDPRQADDYVRSFASHIPGLTIGQYHDLRDTVDKESMAMFGHLGTDGIVKELFDSSLGTPAGVRLFYTELGGMKPSDLDSKTYNAIFAANQPFYQNILNEPGGADPRTIIKQHVQSPTPSPIAAGGPAPTVPNSEAATTADAAPVASDDSSQNTPDPGQAVKFLLDNPPATPTLSQPASDTQRAPSTPDGGRRGDLQ